MRGSCVNGWRHSIARIVSIEKRKRDPSIIRRSWKRLCGVGRRGEIRSGNNGIENIGRKRKGRVVDWSGGDFMQGAIGNIFIEYNITGVEEVVRSEGSYTVTSTTGGVAHEKAFTRFSAKFCLKLERDVSEAADTPDFEMGNIRFRVFQDLERSDIFRQRGGDCEIEKETGSQGSFTPVSERELSCCEHCKHATLDGAEYPLHLPVLPVFVSWNDLPFDPHFFQCADEFMASQFSRPIYPKTDDLLPSLSLPARLCDVKCFSRLILAGQAMDLQDIC
jgi:hypothetical protein